MVEAVVASGLVGGQTSTRVSARDDLLSLGGALFQPLMVSCYLLLVEFAGGMTLRILVCSEERSVKKFKKN